MPTNKPEENVFDDGVDIRILQQIQILKREMNALIRLNAEQAMELTTIKRKLFADFNNEECWVYQGDGHDNLESLVCPVVIAPNELHRLVQTAAVVDNDPFGFGAPSPEATEYDRAIGVEELRKLDFDVTLHAGYIKVQSYINDEYVKPFVQMMINQEKAK